MYQWVLNQPVDGSVQKEKSALGRMESSKRMLLHPNHQGPLHISWKVWGNEGEGVQVTVVTLIIHPPLAHFPWVDSHINIHTPVLSQIRPSGSPVFQHSVNKIQASFYKEGYGAVYSTISCWYITSCVAYGPRRRIHFRADIPGFPIRYSVCWMPTVSQAWCCFSRRNSSFPMSSSARPAQQRSEPWVAPQGQETDIDILKIKIYFILILIIF